jgi:hypothetical protein
MLFFILKLSKKKNKTLFSLGPFAFQIIGYTDGFDTSNAIHTKIY